MLPAKTLASTCTFTPVVVVPAVTVTGLAASWIPTELGVPKNRIP
jgi:hypothetical protein